MWGRLAQHRRACLLGLAVSALLASAAVVFVNGVPVPAIHDEFSHLLAAETLAAGRLSNPPHPLWQHFETMHVLQVPTYASKFPPAQGVVLAIGILLGGQPIVGVWLSAALMIAAIYWMLLAWSSPRWALLGGTFALLHFAAWGPWTQTYWGAAVAGLGGALVLGAAGWMRRRDRLRDGALLGLGLAALATSRPYEGLSVALPVLTSLLIAIARGPTTERLRRAVRQLVPVAAVAGAGLGFLALHQQRVTGDPWLPPFVLWERTYSDVTLPLFDLVGGGGEPNPVEYRHERMQRFAEYNHAASPPLRSAREVPYVIARRLHGVWQMAVAPYTGPLGALVIVLLPWLLARRRLRLPVVTALLGVALLTMPTWRAERHFAPCASAAMLIVVACVRIVASARFGRPWLRRGVPLAFLIVSLAAAAWQSLDALRSPQLAAVSWSHQRARLQHALAREGRHLVVVRYGKDHDIHQEWVYNAADIDAAPVVWARDMGPARNAELLAYFGDRRAWLLEPPREFAGPPVLVPYPSAPASAASTLPTGPAEDP